AAVFSDKVAAVTADVDEGIDRVVLAHGDDGRAAGRAGDGVAVVRELRGAAEILPALVENVRVFQLGDRRVGVERGRKSDALLEVGFEAGESVRGESAHGNDEANGMPAIRGVAIVADRRAVPMPNDRSGTCRRGCSRKPSTEQE